MALNKTYPWISVVQFIHSLHFSPTPVFPRTTSINQTRPSKPTRHPMLKIRLAAGSWFLYGSCRHRTVLVDTASKASYDNYTFLYPGRYAVWLDGVPTIQRNLQPSSLYLPWRRRQQIQTYIVLRPPNVRFPKTFSHLILNFSFASIINLFLRNVDTVWPD